MEKGKIIMAWTGNGRDIVALSDMETSHLKNVYNVLLGKLATLKKQDATAVELGVESLDASPEDSREEELEIKRAIGYVVKEYRSRQSSDGL